MAGIISATCRKDSLDQKPAAEQKRLMSTAISREGPCRPPKPSRQGSSTVPVQESVSRTQQQRAGQGGAAGSPESGVSKLQGEREGSRLFGIIDTREMKELMRRAELHKVRPSSSSRHRIWSVCCRSCRIVITAASVCAHCSLFPMSSRVICHGNADINLSAFLPRMQKSRNDKAAR